MTEPVQTPGLPARDEPALVSVPDVLGASHYALQPHPLLPLPGADTVAALLAKPGGDVELTKLLNDRGQLIWLMETDPFHYGAELDHWRDADALLKLVTILMVFGGNRAGKSEFAAKRVVKTLLEHPGALLLVLHESLESSIATVQKLIWKYLPPEIKALNGRGHQAVTKISYSQANGFTGQKVVFPNTSELVFGAYKQDPGIYEGWELGAKQAPVLGAWADENMPLPWLRMLVFRLASRAAKLGWTFTAVNGMTSTIKDAVGTTPQTLETREAELLPGRVNVPGLPAGHMPFVQVPFMEDARVIYFFSKWNPFGQHYQQIKKLCVGRPSEFVERRAYGYARDTGARAFPLFGEWNVIQQSDLPAEGTNYLCTDPAGARNWATLWLRVAPGNPGALYIYRDWPDYRRYGEWAVTAANPDKLDGDPGPAQPSIGYGPVEYKKLFLREERVQCGARSAESGMEKDPYRLALLAAAGEGHAQEVIRERLIDPRAGRNQHAVDTGGICLVDKLAQVDRNKDGEILAAGMEFQPARGVDIEDGVSQINTLLYWDKEKELMPLVNYPRLFVADNCKQVIWALQNWTGNDGPTGACKDFIDVLRYLITWDVRHITPGRVRTSGGGAY